MLLAFDSSERPCNSEVLTNGGKKFNTKEEGLTV